MSMSPPSWQSLYRMGSLLMYSYGSEGTRGYGFRFVPWGLRIQTKTTDTKDLMK